MVSPLTFISRVTHLTTAALLFTVAVHPFIYGAVSAPPKLGLLTAVVGTLSLLTGLLNAHILQPKRMGNKAGFYRFCVYGIKVVLFLACTPLLDKALTSAGQVELVRPARLAAVGALFLVASYTRYYREEHQQPLPTAPAQAQAQAQAAKQA